MACKMQNCPSGHSFKVQSTMVRYKKIPTDRCDGDNFQEIASQALTVCGGLPSRCSLR